MSITVSIQTPVKELLDRIPVDLHEASKHAAGRGVRRMLMDYLKGLDSSHANQLGGKRSHYYADAAKMVDYSIISDGAAVTVHQIGIALHYYGGTVKPTGGRTFLTIPVDPEAYGRSAREFDNLEIAWGRSQKDGRVRPIGLVTRNDWKYETRKNRKTGAKEVTTASWQAGKWMYALVYSATIKADKTILPSEETIQAAALTSVTDYVINRLRGAVA